MSRVYFITHPEVVIDPRRPIPEWPLSERGIERMKAMLAQPWVDEIEVIYSSRERKAQDGARILAQHLDLNVSIVNELGENDRSSTGYLPTPEFEATVDQFFARPQESIRGWERSIDAQTRIVAAVQQIHRETHPERTIAIVAHGAVGALLLCHLDQRPISRASDQPPTAGGNFFSWCRRDNRLLHDWKSIDRFEPK